MDELRLDMALLKLSRPVEEVTPVSLYREADETVRLQPANSAMEPIFVRPPQVLDIRGVVRGVLRRF